MSEPLDQSTENENSGVKQVTVDPKTCQVLYPAYIDSSKTVSDGRRIPVEKCVENPTAKQMSESLENLGYKCFVEEDKRYPRDWMKAGRVRVLWKVNNKLIKPDHPTKRNLLTAIAQEVPSVPSRKEEEHKRKIEKEKQQDKQLRKERKKESARGRQQTAGPGGGGGGGKKKGRRRRK
eukprot:gb/GECH01013341.1/.p1 GENE.gb/GECH01013341.1/~~gb/GECH01013341.1/.p1  ORF type:complete len:178 (+),score=63.25 gb/GECH01013341.1/:1-534(+)